jgi:anti-sigma regulatory factor (Ser/Thr protein kinase)
MDVTLPARHVSISLAIEEPSGVGEARRSAMKLAEALQLSQADIGRAALVVTEAATNIVQHAQRGEILLRPVALESPARLEVMALDRGPGMANVGQALRDGFSTGGSSGLGLGAIARLSTRFEISSGPGKGTALLAHVGRAAPAPSRAPGLEWGLVCVPKRDEKLCGDGWAVSEGRDRSSVLIVDGLGHGPAAFEVARRALRAFAEHAAEPPEPLLNLLDKALHTTRGAVAAVTEVDWTRRQVRYAGAGNIAGTLVTGEGQGFGLVSQPGTLGQGLARVQEVIRPWPDDGLLILHSDGLSNRWELEGYPGLTRKHPSLIAGVLYRDFASRRDDVVVLVARERPPASPGPGGESG